MSEDCTAEIIHAWVNALEMTDQEAADFERWYRERYA